MFISKFWTLLLALSVGLMLAIILLGKDLVNRERIGSTTEILYKEMTKTDVALKLHARERLDVLLTLALDRDVRKFLYTASAGPEKASKIRSQLLSILRKRNKELGNYTADLLVALNMKGEAICQVGKNEREHGYNLAGFPAVDAALRGYVRDDVWKISNDVLLIGARPVIEQGRYVGVLVHAMKVNDKLATDLSPSVQLAFFTGNVMSAVGSLKTKGIEKAQGAHIIKPLDKVLKSERFKKEGYSDVERIGTPDQEFLAVYSKVRGEAASNEVGFALVMPVERMTTATEFYDKAGTQDIDALPKVWLIVGIVLAFILGWLWNYLEGERPLSRLLKSINALEKSDPKDQLNIYKFRRKTRKIAAAVNSMIDFKLRAVLENTDNSSKNIDSILGKSKDVRLSSASFKFAEPSASEVPPPPPADDGKDSDDKKDENPKPPPPSAPNDVLPKAPNTAFSSPKPPPAPPSGAQKPPAPTPPAADSAPAMSPEEEQEYFHEIYDKFIELKKKLDEPTEQLTFERFLGTLKKNRDTLMARYDCKQVKFQVYEKAGKASLKATPVK
ncbi:MAG: hypothetical protein GY854_03180 [Deltaproteobacteria bacterium]|nr:hypothetical protein [Deltaproteobacteria bacterium]